MEHIAVYTCIYTQINVCVHMYIVVNIMAYAMNVYFDMDYGLLGLEFLLPACEL